MVACSHAATPRDGAFQSVTVAATYRVPGAHVGERLWLGFPVLRLRGASVRVVAVRFAHPQPELSYSHFYRFAFSDSGDAYFTIFRDDDLAQFGSGKPDGDLVGTEFRPGKPIYFMAAAIRVAVRGQFRIRDFTVTLQNRAGRRYEQRIAADYKIRVL